VTKRLAHSTGREPLPPPLPALAGAEARATRVAAGRRSVLVSVESGLRRRIALARHPSVTIVTAGVPLEWKGVGDNGNEEPQ
jgi:hypothetical protein